MATPHKKKKGKRLSLSVQIERAMRNAYPISQLERVISDIVATEYNALFLSTPEGRKVRGFTEEEATSVMKKQAEHRLTNELELEFWRVQVDKLKAA